MSHINQMMITESNIHFLVRTAIINHTTGGYTPPAQIVSDLVGYHRGARRQSQSLDAGWQVQHCLLVQSTSDAETDLQALLGAETVAAAASIVEQVMIRRIASAMMISETDINLNERFRSDVTAQSIEVHPAEPHLAWLHPHRLYDLWPMCELAACNAKILGRAATIV